MWGCPSRRPQRACLRAYEHLGSMPRRATAPELVRRAGAPRHAGGSGAHLLLMIGERRRLGVRCPFAIDGYARRQEVATTSRRRESRVELLRALSLDGARLRVPLSCTCCSLLCPSSWADVHRGAQPHCCAAVVCVDLARGQGADHRAPKATRDAIAGRRTSREHQGHVLHRVTTLIVVCQGSEDVHSFEVAARHAAA